MLEESALNFKLLSDLVYDRVLSDTLPRQAKANFLDSLLWMAILEGRESATEAGGGRERHDDEGNSSSSDDGDDSRLVDEGGQRPGPEESTGHAEEEEKAGSQNMPASTTAAKAERGGKDPNKQMVSECWSPRGQSDDSRLKDSLSLQCWCLDHNDSSELLC